MVPYSPLLGAPRAQLGQAGSLAQTIARKVVEQAEEPVRRIVREERNRLAEAFIGGIPLSMLSTLSYVGTAYLVPAGNRMMKAAGYGTSAAFMLGSAWWTLSHLREHVPPAPPRESSFLDPLVESAAAGIAAEAEPRIRRILAEEKAIAASALQAALPFGIGSAAVFLATMFLVGSDDPAIKAVGYSGSALLLGAGAWTAFEKEKGPRQ